VFNFVKKSFCSSFFFLLRIFFSGTKSFYRYRWLGYPTLLGILIVSSVFLSLCFYVSISLCISISPRPNLTLDMPACWPTYPPTPVSQPLPPLSLTHPPSLFPDKKFPVEAHFWLDKLFLYKLGYPCLACVKLFLFVSVFFFLSLCVSFLKKSYSNLTILLF
jgi:hypothetical protein